MIDIQHFLALPRLHTEYENRLPGGLAHLANQRAQHLRRAVLAGQKHYVHILLPQDAHRVLRAFHRLHGHGGLLQSILHVRHAPRRIADQQQTAVLHRVRAVIRLCVHLELQQHFEAAAFARRTLDVNHAAHHVHNALAYRHAQPRALHLVRHGILRTGEHVEQVLLELLRHADAVVLDHKGIFHIRMPAAGHLAHVKADFAALLGVLDRVGQDVQQHLPQTGRIADEILVVNLARADDKVLPALARLRANDGFNLLNLLSKIDFIHAQRHRAALNFGHVQHVIDQP